VRELLVILYKKIFLLTLINIYIHENGIMHGCAELESGDRQSIRIDCGPAVKNPLNHLQEEDEDGDQYIGKTQNHYDSTRLTTTNHDDDGLAELTSAAVTSPMTSSPPAAETSAAVAVTTGHVIKQDEGVSSASSLNVSCELFCFVFF